MQSRVHTQHSVTLQWYPNALQLCIGIGKSAAIKHHPPDALADWTSHHEMCTCSQRLATAEQDPTLIDMRPTYVLLHAYGVTCGPQPKVSEGTTVDRVAKSKHILIHSQFNNNEANNWNYLRTIKKDQWMSNCVLLCCSSFSRSAPVA